MKGAGIILFLLLLVLVLFGVVIVAPWVSPEIAYERAQQEHAKTVAAQRWAEQADERAAATTAALTILLVGGSLVLTLGGAGLAVAAVRGAALRSHTLLPQPETALYPALVDQSAGAGQWQVLNLNQDRAQLFAALPGRPSAPVTRALLSTAPYAPPPPAPVAVEAELDHLLPARTWPDRAEVYDAPLPRRPALMIGVDGTGAPVELALHNLGSVLVAGLPGYGKTELLAAMLAGMIRRDPKGAYMRTALLDPKRADFSLVPDDLAALAYPPARNLADGVAILAALQAECEHRFALFADAGAKNLLQYNTQPGHTRTPYLVAMVDEWASFMDVAGFNERALYLARMGRAAGIVLVLATQRPSARVISTDVRAMAGAAIAFRCRSTIDSRAILDAGDAADLPATPGRCIVARGEFRTVQAYAAGLETGKFDAFVAAAHRGVPVPVPAAPTHAHLAEQEQEQEQTELKWQGFVTDFMRRHPDAGATALARAMAMADGRAADWANYKSEAWRRMNNQRQGAA